MISKTWMSLISIVALGAAICSGQSVHTPKDRLFSRIYGCEAAVRIANAMGASVEGWPYERIEKTYGVLDKFLPEDQKESLISIRFGPQFATHAYHREPGWGEDGMERYRLLTSAILLKGGRVNIDDVSQQWIDSLNPARFGYNVGPQDQCIYYLMKAGVPPSETGRWALWPGFMGTSKMIVPIGIINAGRPDNAARDALDITRFKDVQGRPIWRDDTRRLAKSKIVVYDYALEAAAGIAAGIAEALGPDATVESVIGAVLAQLPRDARVEADSILKWAGDAKTLTKFRPVYQNHYAGRTPNSNAMEILCGGLACFKLAGGQPREAILYGVNLGRDTDCKAYVAGSLAGALRGIEAIPQEWVRVVETAVQSDPYTVSKRSALEAAEGFYSAYANERRISGSAVSEIESSLSENRAGRSGTDTPNTSLFDRIYGAEAGATIGSSMGAVVNGMTVGRIREQYGMVRALMEYRRPSRSISQRFGPGWFYREYTHAAGMTEGGMERHRLTTAAILKNNGRVNVEDVARQWVESIDTAKFGYLLGPEDHIVYSGLKGGLPPWEVGRYSQSPGSFDAAMMVLPLGIVNACFPDEAVRDALDVARLKAVQGRALGNHNGEIIFDYGVEASGAVAGAVAEALRPGATVNSVVLAALARLPGPARTEVDSGVAMARRAKSWQELAGLFEAQYGASPSSSALEVLTGSLACFAFAEGDPSNAIVYSVNLGREAAARASVAGGLAGAMRGIKALPTEWVGAVEKEAAADSFTVSRLTARQAAEGLYRACLNEMEKTRMANVRIGSLMTE